MEQAIAPKYRIRRTRGIATVRDVADWLAWLGAKMRNSFKVEIEGAKRSSYQPDGMTHSVFDLDHAWRYVINAQILATQNFGSLPGDTGLFVAGKEVGRYFTNQTNWQTWTQVVEFVGAGLYRRIAVTLYASSLYSGETAPDGVYRGDITATIELVGPSGVYDTFDVTATESGYTFTMDAPTPEEFYYMRFKDAPVAVVLPVTGVVKNNLGEDVFLTPSQKPFKLSGSGLLRAETLNALIRWVEASLVYKPPSPALKEVSDTAEVRKSTPSKPTYTIKRKGGFAYVSDARDLIKWLAKRMAEN